MGIARQRGLSLSPVELEGAISSTTTAFFMTQNDLKNLFFSKEGHELAVKYLLIEVNSQLTKDGNIGGYWTQGDTNYTFEQNEDGLYVLVYFTVILEYYSNLMKTQDIMNLLNFLKMQESYIKHKSITNRNVFVKLLLIFVLFSSSCVPRECTVEVKEYMDLISALNPDFMRIKDSIHELDSSYFFNLVYIKGSPRDSEFSSNSVSSYEGPSRAINYEQAI